MTDLINTFLQNQGFNKNDINIYLDICRHGKSYASSIAARTKIDRTTVYSVIKRLLKKGVIVQTQVNGVNAYVAVEADIFVDEVDSKMEKLEAEKRVALNFVDQVKTVRAAALPKPKMRVYEGEQAIINLYEETLKKGGAQKAFIKVDRLPEQLRDFFKRKYIESKHKYDVFSRVIAADSEVARRYQAKDGRSNRKTKLVKKHPFDMHAEILLFGESEVAIVDFHQQLWGIVIDSPTLYQTVEAVFDFMWEEL